MDAEQLYMGKTCVGHMRFWRQGLYYVFCCRCALPGDMPWRVEAFCGQKREDLGVLVPMEEGFGLDTRRPVKRLGEGKLEFRLLPGREQPGTRFAPIYPEEPFAYLARLKDAFLEERGGIWGAGWKEE